MAFQLSPGVLVTEEDRTTVVPAVATTAGAFSGAFQWGPVDQVITVDTENNLVERFGKPDDTTANYFFTAANFLSYGNNLQVVRKVNKGVARNAVSQRTGSVSNVTLVDTSNAFTLSDPIAVTFTAPNNTNGVTATGNAVLSSEGIVSAISIGQRSYGFTEPPVITFSGGGGTGANATASIATGILANVFVVDGGNNYTSNANIIFSGGGTSTQATANLVLDANGTIIDVVITSNSGSYFSAPNVTINRNDSNTGANAVVTPRISALLNTITITSPGIGYTSAPNITITRSANDYVGFANAEATAILGFTVSNINITNPGSGYTSAPNVTILSAANVRANGTVSISLTSPLITNEDNYDASYSLGGLLFLEWAARYPGELGNSIRVSVADSNTYSSWQYANNFESTPGTSAYVNQRGGSSDELHIIVIDATSAITGTAGTVLEKFSFLSKARDAKNSDGSTNYYKDVINSQSKYIWWMNHPSSVTNWGSLSTTTFDNLSSNLTTQLSGGVDGNELSTANVLEGYQVFSNDELYDVSLIPMGPTNDVSAVNSVISLAETRRDSMVFVSPPYNNVVNVTDSATRITTYRDTLTSSSFAVLDSGWKYQYDRYNDKYRYVPLNGDTAGLAARTDYVADPWFSPAGYNRGVLKNVVKLAYSPSKADRDTLYKKGVNPIVTFPGQGTILFGDKTLLSRPSAFDRINVRRLFIVLEKAIATAAKFQLFEFNDAFTRAQFRNLVEPFLRDVQGRRGITDFRVICDETNNTSEVIDRNEFVADIFIKPARSINFIQLNFIATRSGVSFEEVGA